MKQPKLFIVGLIAIGIVIGMALSWIFIFASVNSFINNVLPNVQIENVNFNLNETALIDGLNKTIKQDNYDVYKCPILLEDGEYKIINGNLITPSNKTIKCVKEDSSEQENNHV